MKTYSLPGRSGACLTSRTGTLVGQARVRRVPPAEPQHRLRRDHRAVVEEAVRVAEGDERKVDPVTSRRRPTGPCPGYRRMTGSLSAAHSSHARRSGRLVSNTISPRAKRGPDGPQRLLPVGVGQEDLRHVAGHHREVSPPPRATAGGVRPGDFPPGSLDLAIATTLRPGRHPRRYGRPRPAGPPGSPSRTRRRESVMPPVPGRCPDKRSGQLGPSNAS